MRIVGRVLLVIAVFLGIAYFTMHLLIARAIAHGAPEYTVRMGGALGGLFAGGAAATLVMLVMLLGGKRTLPASRGDEIAPPDSSKRDDSL